jgi:hypothetical protein
MKTIYLYLGLLCLSAWCFLVNNIFPSQMEIILYNPPQFSIMGVPMGILTVGSIFVSIGIACVGTCVLYPLFRLLMLCVD